MTKEHTPKSDGPSAGAIPSQEAHLARALAVARRGMRKYRNALKELAGLKAEQPTADDSA